MTFSSSELNFLIWRYLQDCGFARSAITFFQESHVCDTEIDGRSVCSGALPIIVQKGLFYSEAELSVNATRNGDGSSTPAIENLSLLEAVTLNPLSIQRPRLRDKQTAGTSFSMPDKTTKQDVKDVQKERDREARTQHVNGVKGQPSPRSNGNNSVQSKKQHAVNNSHADGTTVANGDLLSPPLRSPKTISPKASSPEDPTTTKFSNDKLRFLKCHTSEVFICAWNPKNDLMASGSGDSTGRIWDLRNSEDKSILDKSFESNTRILKHSTAGEQEKSNKDVTSLDWSSNGDMLATGCYDGYARIWTTQGSLRSTLGAHKGPIFALKWNSAGNNILSAGVDKTTIVWDAVKGQKLQQFCFHTASALDVDWINADTFASCSTDKTIHLCRLGCDRPVLTYRGHDNEVNAIKYDPHSQRLASCSDDMTLRIWSLQEEAPVRVWKAHQKEIYTIRWSPLGHTLASASFDHTVRLWDVSRAEATRTLTKHCDPVYSVAFSPDGRYLASGCFDRSVFIWDIHNGKLLQSYTGNKIDGGIFEVSWNHRGDKVAASASDGTVILMDVRHIKNKLY